MGNFNRDEGGGGAVQPVYIKVKGTPLLQIFPTHYTQKNHCTMIGSPSEGGQKQFDNKVNNPSVVQFTGIVKYAQRSVFEMIRQMMKSYQLENLLCEFQSKAGRITNMIIESLEEVGESNRYDGMEIKVSMQEYLEHNANKGS